jgi:hypothetical protein
MKGCVLVGKVKFEDGKIPAPIWPEKREPRPDGDDPGEGSGR